MSSFEPIRTDVLFDVNVGQTRADLGEIRRVYAQTTGAMSDDALRLAVAQEKLNRTLARSGAESTAAKTATLQYRTALQSVAAEAERASLVQQRAAERATAAQVRAAQTVGHALTRYVSAPTALIAFEAVKMRVQFERQMLMIQTQAGATGAEVANLHDKVLQLAKAAPQSPEELAKGLYHLESLGLRGANALTALKTSSTAAFMGVADLEQVTTALGGAVVTGIKGTENYDRAMGALNATVGAGNMRMEDLVAALGTGILPAAENAGLSLDQVGAALAVLTDRGMGADESATRLRMTFALIEAPSKKATKALKDMGINSHDLNALLRQPDGLLKVLQLLHDQMDSVGKVRGSRDIIEAFGGGRSSAAILTLIQSLDAGVSSYQQKLGDVRRNTDKFFRDQHDVKNSDAYKLAAAWSSVQVDLIKLGATITPIVVSVAGGLADVADKFDHLGKTGKHAIELIIGLLAIGGPLLLTTAAVVRAVQTIGGAFATIPAEAAPAIAATDAELATIGATATATAAEADAALAGIGVAATGAGGEVAGLRGALLGLTALDIVVPITLLAVGTPALIHMMHWGGTGVSRGFGGSPRSGGTFAQAHPDSDYAKWSPEERAAEAAKREHYDHTYDWYLNHPAAALRVLNRNTSGMSNDPVHDAQDRRQPPPATATPSTAVVTPYKPSRAAKLNLALAKNPNDVASIRAKIAYDREAAAFAQKRISEGRGSAKLEQELEGVYQDIASLEGQLKSMSDATASKRAEAARKAAAAARKRAEAVKREKAKLEHERQQRIERLTQVPVSLQIAEVQAELHHASEAKLKKIYERELAAVKEQLVTLRKIGATKAQQLNAMNTEEAIQQKIDGLQSTTSSTSLFDQAASEFATYGSNIGGRNGILSPQDARAEVALDVLKAIAGHTGATRRHTGRLVRDRRTPIDGAATGALAGWSR